MQSIEKLPNGLDLIQDDDFFKLGQDSILLSDFAKPRKFANVLDLGAGVGTLSFLCWRADLKITGLELQDGAVQIFNKSIEHNKLDNIKAIQGDLKYIRNYFSHGSIDYVICNPPYFKVNDKNFLNESEEKKIARHEVMISLEEVIMVSSKLLKNNGTFAMVHRTERLLEIFEFFHRYHIEPKRIRFVHENALKPSTLVLIEGIKNGKTGLKVEAPFLMYYTNGSPTNEYSKFLVEVSESESK